MDRRQLLKLGVGVTLLGNTFNKQVFAGDSEEIKAYPISEYEDSVGPFSHDELIGLTEKFGSPLYVYNASTIKDRVNEFKDAFIRNYPNVKIHYACKANSNINILKIINNQGIHAECISMAEIQLASKAGFNKKDIFYTSSSKSMKELKFSVQNDVIVNLDSLPDLENLISVLKTEGKKVRISFRINPDVNPNTHKNISTGHKLTKFGILQHEEELLKAYKMALEHPKIIVSGVHSHIGSQILELDPFIKNVKIVSDVAMKIKKHFNHELEFINLGGGLGIPYRDGQSKLSPQDYASAVCPLLKENLKSFKKLPELHLEPGRYFVAESSVLLATVNSIKHTPWNNFVNVDTGFNHLARPLLYDAHHRVRILGKTKANSTVFEVYDVAGNICETGDILAHARKLPVPAVGDIVVFLDTGAYGFSMSSEYNSFALPGEVIKVGKEFKLIRKRAEFKDLLRRQILVRSI